MGKCSQAKIIKSLKTNKVKVQSKSHYSIVYFSCYEIGAQLKDLLKLASVPEITIITTENSHLSSYPQQGRKERPREQETENQEKMHSLLKTEGLYNGQTTLLPTVFSSRIYFILGARL